MNALVIYHSEFGNTRQVAEAIAEVLQVLGAAHALNIAHLSEADLQGASLVLMGTPTHKMNLPQAARPVLDTLPRHILRGVPVAAFDTSYKMSAILARFTAAKRLDRELRKLGGKRLVPPETFFVHENHEGPLYDGEIERARHWAESILLQLDGQTG